METGHAGSPVLLWRVWLPSQQGLINVRSQAALHSEVLAQKKHGDSLRGVDLGDWVELVDQPGYCRKKGPDGILLYQVPSDPPGGALAGDSALSEVLDKEAALLAQLAETSRQLQIEQRRLVEAESAPGPLTAAYAESLKDSVLAGDAVAAARTDAAEALQQRQEAERRLAECEAACRVASVELGDTVSESRSLAAHSMALEAALKQQGARLEEARRHYARSAAERSAELELHRAAAVAAERRQIALASQVKLLEAETWWQQRLRDDSHAVLIGSRHLQESPVSFARTF